MRNSERRRRALVRSCACIRLESAIRTAIADETTAEEFMKQAPNEKEFRYVLMVGVLGAGLKETCHIIRWSLSNRENRRRCCGNCRSVPWIWKGFLVNVRGNISVARLGSAPSS